MADDIGPHDGRQRIPPLSAFEESARFTRAIRVGERIIVAGNIGVEADGSISSDAGRQAERCFEQIIDYIQQLGGPQVGPWRRPSCRNFIRTNTDVRRISLGSGKGHNNIHQFTSVAGGGTNPDTCSS